MPEGYRQLAEIRDNLEQHYRDMQDIEFTIENGKLYMLQTRNGKRTAAAAMKIAVDMVEEGLIDEKTRSCACPAPARPAPAPVPRPEGRRAQSSPRACRPRRAPPPAGRLHRRRGRGGGQSGRKVILVRIETSPEDIHGMHAAQGILTARGGMTSHAAVVARGMGKCCVAGCGDIKVDYAPRHLPPGTA